MKHVAVILIAISIFSSVLAEENCPTDQKILVCYYGSWAVYRPDIGYFGVEYIDPNLCTHLVYTFAGLNAVQNSMVSIDPANDLAGGKDSYKQFVLLKERNPCLKTLLALGGWNEKSRKYSVMASTPESRRAFADNALRFLVQYEFDGLDFDWEYPAARGGIDQDKDNFIALLKELKDKFAPWNLTLTAAVAATEGMKSYDVKSICSLVDYVSIMAYDYTSSTSATTGLLAPLKPLNEADKTLTIDASVKFWINGGCPTNKIILGIPIYARSFKLKDESINGIGAPTINNTLAGKYTREVGFLSIYELLDILDADEYDITTDPTYANNYATNGTYWFTYDSTDTVVLKVNYAHENDLGGIMVWSVDTDDFLGINGEPYAVLRAIKGALYK